MASRWEVKCGSCNWVLGVGKGTVREVARALYGGGESERGGVDGGRERVKALRVRTMVPGVRYHRNPATRGTGISE